MRKKKLSERLWVKIFAYFVTVLSFCSALVCLLGIEQLSRWGFYEDSKADLKQEAMFDLVRSRGMEILNFLEEGQEKAAISYCEGTNLNFWVTDEKGEDIAGYYDTPGHYNHYIIEVDDESLSSLIMYTEDETRMEYIYTEEDIPYLSEGDQMHLYVRTGMIYDDDFLRLSESIDWGYSLKNYLIPMGIALVVVCVASFVIQMCCAGRKYEQDDVTANGLAAIHLDLLTLIMIAIAALAYGIFENYYYFYRNDLLTYIFTGIAAAAGVTLAVGYCLIWAIQVKAGIWWKNTVIYKVFRLIYKVLRFTLRGCRKFCCVFLNSLPQMLQVSLGVLAFIMVEAVLMILWGMDAEDIFLIWFLDKMILVPVALYLAIVLIRLQKGSEALAEGNLAYQVNTRYMFGDFRDHGENLNSIAEGMNLVVEERLKSERLKTELITNVSHDIKTPLTSIINYAELIAEEKTENEKIMEYSQVLKRQSARLKKLIEDLMEASKASTGNIEVHMAPCEVGVLLTQTMGEYEQRLSELGLELIARQPEHPVRIMADGKLLWRIFDNLLHNICKYAMKGTRVYLSVEEKGGKVAIAFKNISKYPLDISAKELMERFVRGDRSRHTEGNGLGLSIAQSLTQLQNGVLELTADGDLFKVVLVFDALAADGAEG